MVYKYHQRWRDLRGQDSDVWDVCDLPEEEKKLVYNMRKSKPAIPYTLEVECTSYWGNFEREFLGYTIGILDDVQMRGDHSEEERTMFWKEVFNKEPIDFEEASESYELYRDYLLETYQGCDDWEQLTFYSIDWDTYHKNGSNVLKIQLAKPLSQYWEEIIIPRMSAFFDKKVCEYLEEDDQLISITLRDKVGNVVNEYGSISEVKPLTNVCIDLDLDSISIDTALSIDQDVWSPCTTSNRCPRCGSNKIEYNTKLILTSYPAQLQLRCKDCGHYFGSGFSSTIAVSEDTLAEWQNLLSKPMIESWNPYTQFNNLHSDEPELEPPSYPDVYIPRKDLPVGWVCPKCGRCYAPHVTGCEHCNDTAKSRK